MKSRIIACIALSIFLANCAPNAQNDPIGDWSGTLTLVGANSRANSRLIFHITESENGYSTTIEILDQQGQQGQQGLNIPTEMLIDGDSIIFTIEQLGVEYIATISGNQIVGEFTQFGHSMPDFTITRNE